MPTVTLGAFVAGGVLGALGRVDVVAVGAAGRMSGIAGACGFEPEGRLQFYGSCHYLLQGLCA